MEISKLDKTKILKAYFDKVIDKEEMEMLIQEGIHIPPIQWIYKNEDDRLKNQRRRDSIGKVLGISFPKIRWISTK